MITEKNLLKFLLAVIIGLVLAMLVHRLISKYRTYDIGPDIEPLIPRPLEVRRILPSFTFLDLNGSPQSTKQWEGKVLIINFWATWCPPCREEIPEFIELQRKLGPKGVQFVGIAIDDMDDVKQFVAVTGFNYPILVGDSRALLLSEQLGNRLQGLPFSVIFDRNGNVIYKTIGAMSQQTIHAQIDPLLKTN